MTASLTQPGPVRVAPTPAVRKWADRYGFTPELVARWAAFLPEPTKQLESFLRPVSRYVRVNTLRTNAADLQHAWERRGFKLTKIEAPDSRLEVLRVDKEPYAVSATPEYLDGEAYLQDLASLLAPAALEPLPGERILDMAAAPGGKTTAIAELVNDNASILAVEPVPHRAAALTSNLRRLGIAGVGVAVRRAETVALGRGFDRILLDAPCTGEGVLPRDRNRRTGNLDEHATLVALQQTLLSHAANLLVPGGTLVYSTCTFAPEECEAAVQFALGLGLEPEPLPFDKMNGVPLGAALTKAGPYTFGKEVAYARRAYPYIHDTLGFFVARFTKPMDASEPVVSVEAHQDLVAEGAA